MTVDLARLETLQHQTFVAIRYEVGASGEYAHIRLANKSDSGVIVEIAGLFVFSETGQQIDVQTCDPVDLNNPTEGIFPSAYITGNPGVTSPNGVVVSGTSSSNRSLDNATGFLRTRVLANQPTAVRIGRPTILAPGTAVQIVAGSASTKIDTQLGFVVRDG